jgi:hypothetical protein
VEIADDGMQGMAVGDVAPDDLHDLIGGVLDGFWWVGSDAAGAEPDKAINRFFAQAGLGVVVAHDA